MTDDRNCLSFWYPKLTQSRQSLPLPPTHIIRASDDLMRLLDGEKPIGWDNLIADLTNACERVGLPAFLRTGHGSDKHDWKSTCYVENVDDLPSHVARLVEWSTMVDLMGLPTRAWAVRKLIDTAPLFYAFTGHMPITREFRFFVRDTKIEHVQPYWPPDSIHMATVDDWQFRLGRASVMADSTRDWLSWLAVSAVSAVGGGYWSVDLLQDREGDWWITDMAEGDRSFKWDQDGAEVAHA